MLLLLGLVWAQGRMAPSQTARYASLPGVAANLNSLDVYTAPQLKQAPVMVYVHGGGWQQGDKANVALKPQAFLQAGYVFVSVNYRLSPQAAFPAHAQDVAAAIAWVKANIANYGGNPERIFLMGHSAGAHLVALVATDVGYLQAHGLSLASLKGVVALDTEAYDLPMLARRSGDTLGGVYAQAFGSDPAFWRRASPIHHIAPAKGIPPMLVAYSGGARGNNAQRRGDYAQDFVQALQQAGVKAQLLPSPGQTHEEINQDFGRTNDAVTQATLAFLAAIP